MIGSIVNFAAIIIGGLIGLLIKNGIPERVERSIMSMQGLAVIVIGANGMLASMLIVNTETGRVSDNGGLLLLISLVVGAALGEVIDIDKRLNDTAKRIEVKLKADGFAKGFVSATLIFAIGAMAIIGALNDGLTGDSSVLIVKSTLDFVVSIILASSLGIGVLFSAIPVFLYQGAISLSASYLSPLLKGELLDNITMVGYALVITIGLNFLFDTKIKTANLLPALLIPIIYAVIMP